MLFSKSKAKRKFQNIFYQSLKTIYLKSEELNQSSIKLKLRS